jgi:HK97 family phage major capsid protein
VKRVVSRHPTLEQVLAQAEDRRRHAEWHLIDLKAAMSRWRATVEADGGKPEHPPERMVESGNRLARELCEAQHELQKAEGGLASLREIEAEEIEYQRVASTPSRVQDRAPGGPPDRVYRIGDAAGAAYRPAPDEWTREDGRAAAVGRDQPMASHEVVADIVARDPGRRVTETYSGVGQLVRALSTTGSSAIVPTVWGASIIDRARNAAQVVAAGAETIPMDSKTLQLGRLTTDPTTAWLAEGGTRAASDPVFDSVTLTAKTLTCLTVASIEFLQDAVNADQVVEDAIGSAMGLAIDYAALFGGVTAGGEGINQPSPPSPLGILANLLANAASSVLGSAANGTTITATTPWNELLDLWYTPQQYNETPNAILVNAKMAQKYAKSYDTTGPRLGLPPALANVPFLTTNQIPSFTQGTMANIATDIFAGDFRLVLVGQRLDLTIQVLTERYAELGQVGVLATFRGDVQLARPRAMAVYRYIGGS